MKRRLVWVLVAVVAVGGLATLGGYAFLQRGLAAVNPGDTEGIQVVVPSGAGTRQVADLLQQQGLIRDRRVFEWYCRVQGLDGRLQAGRYLFNRGQTLPEIADDLAHGRVMMVSFTVPEGLTLAEIGQVVVRSGLCSEEEWEEALRGEYHYGFLAGIPARDNRLEGFLFPDTYKVSTEVTAPQLVDMMLARFSREWERRFAADAKAAGMDVVQVVTLASLVEEEARLDSERAVIAGVLHNRLQRGMLLQVDASVLYALGGHRPRVLYRDLEVDSPYNTYRYPGLPPGPIASPGAASLAAALHPARHDYLYYVHVGDGRHQFSRTLAEHNQAVAASRR